MQLQFLSIQLSKLVTRDSSDLMRLVDLVLDVARRSLFKTVSASGSFDDRYCYVLAMQGVTSVPVPPASAGVTAPPAPVGSGPPAAAVPATAAVVTGAAEPVATDGGRPPPDVLSLAQSRLGDLTTSMYTYLGILQSAAPPAGDSMGDDARRQQEGLFEKAPEYAKEIGAFGTDGGARALWFIIGGGEGRVVLSPRRALCRTHS